MKNNAIFTYDNVKTNVFNINVSLRNLCLCFQRIRDGFNVSN